MKKNTPPTGERKFLALYLLLSGAGLLVVVILVMKFETYFPSKYERSEAASIIPVPTHTISSTPKILPLDKALYDKKMLILANNDAPNVVTKGTSTSTTTKPSLWPVKTVYPNAGALLPFGRIIAYYGNLYSTKMGVLGEYAPDVMKQKLAVEVKKWEAADPDTPVIPALDYIAITAQGSPGTDGKYRFRMPGSEIDKVLALALPIHAIVILDIQVGLSDVQTEIPLLEKYLKMPNVHLALDPEFDMPNSKKPGTVIGTMNAADINFVSNYLAKLVRDNNLPPKVLVIHRFTQGMVTNYKQIVNIPEVQIVMDMDGWGPQAKKIGTYNAFIVKEPVEFTGFKLFYKNDIKEASSSILTPAQLLKLKPQPSFIQFQ
jgi:hypothetical protein